MTVSKPLAPRGLSAKSRRIWRRLLTDYGFGTHERAHLEAALRWQDRSEALAVEADAPGADTGRLLKLATDAASTSLRYWRLLKFSDGQQAARPGRPSGDAWSPKRREAARQRREVA